MTKELQELIRENHPTATKDELEKLYIVALRDDPDAAEATMETVFWELLAFDRDRLAKILLRMKRNGSEAGDSLSAMIVDMMKRH